jgi:hypothetical protein
MQLALQKIQATEGKKLLAETQALEFMYQTAEG